MRKLNLRKTLFILPSLFTLSSIFCGFYATLLCIGEPDGESFYAASWLIVFAMFFDSIDGRVARLTKTQSAFGVQIDSLADVVSFGVAPGLLAHAWSLSHLGMLGTFVSFAFVACGAIRLARFNVLAMSESGAPKKPGKYIVGLPIPGAAGVLVSVVVANYAVGGSLERTPEIVLALMILLSFFMVSTIQFRSFKDVKLNVRTVVLVGLALAGCATLAVVFHPSFALVGLLACYLVMGVAESLFNLSRRGLSRRRAARGLAPAEDAEAVEQG